MLVLTIILVPTINVSAKSYVADDSVTISSDMHNFYNNYFDPTDSYLYFPYDCNDRTCYYGINQDNEYLDISYTSSSSSYSYERIITSGTDDNFSVTGNNIIRKSVSPTYILLVAIVFFGLIKIVDGLDIGDRRDKFNN